MCTAFSLYLHVICPGYIPLRHILRIECGRSRPDSEAWVFTTAGQWTCGDPGSYWTRSTSDTSTNKHTSPYCTADGTKNKLSNKSSYDTALRSIESIISISSPGRFFCDSIGHFLGLCRLDGSVINVFLFINVHSNPDFYASFQCRTVSKLP